MHVYLQVSPAEFNGTCSQISTYGTRRLWKSLYWRCLLDGQIILLYQEQLNDLRQRCGQKICPQRRMTRRDKARTVNYTDTEWAAHSMGGSLSSHESNFNGFFYGTVVCPSPEHRHNWPKLSIH